MSNSLRKGGRLNFLYHLRVEWFLPEGACTSFSSGLGRLAGEGLHKL